MVYKSEKRNNQQYSSLILKKDSNKSNWTPCVSKNNSLSRNCLIFLTSGRRKIKPLAHSN